MSYTFNIPTNGQSLGNSRPQVNGNFTYINTAFSVNHIAFNQVNVGKHYKVEMPRQSPSPTPAATEGMLFTKLSGGITRLIWKRDGGATDIELTGVNPSAATNGYSTLPGGLIIQWGVVTTTSSSGTVTFATNNISFPTACFMVNTTPKYSTAGGVPTSQANYSPNQTTLSNLKFDWVRVTNSSSYQGFYWIAIGN